MKTFGGLEIGLLAESEWCECPGIVSGEAEEKVLVKRSWYWK